jgi:hypothetical protein
VYFDSQNKIHQIYCSNNFDRYYQPRIKLACIMSSTDLRLYNKIERTAKVPRYSLKVDMEEMQAGKEHFVRHEKQCGRARRRHLGRVLRFDTSIA